MPTHYTYTYWSKALSYVRVTCGVVKLLAGCLPSKGKREKNRLVQLTNRKMLKGIIASLFVCNNVMDKDPSIVSTIVARDGDYSTLYLPVSLYIYIVNQIITTVQAVQLTIVCMLVCLDVKLFSMFETLGIEKRPHSDTSSKFSYSTLLTSFLNFDIFCTLQLRQICLIPGVLE